MLKRGLIVVVFLILGSFVSAIPPIPTIPPFPDIQSNGNTYYVNKDTGSNGNSGADGDEWATIAYGISQLSAGDTLIVEEAATAYSETLQLTNINGNANQWYQIKGKSGERPTISGGFDVGSGTASSYIYIGNFDITTSGYAGFRTRKATTHIVFDDLDVGSTGSFAIVIGTIYETGSSDIYLRDVVAHGGEDTIQLYARSHDIVMERVTAYGSTGDDVIGSHNAYGPSETWQDIGPPEDNADTISDVYIVDSVIYNSDSNGIDLAVVRGKTVIKNTKVYGNMDGGIKVWGLEVWLINNLIYENDQRGTGDSGITIKPHWINSHYYLIGNTVVKNGGSGNKMELRISYMNGGQSGYELKSPLIYLYNNLFQADGATILFLDGPNCPHETCFVEGDNNLYFKPSDNNYGVIEYDGNWGTDHTFGIDDMSDGTWYSASGIDNNAVSSTSGSDPGFTNLANDDFSLKDGSLAINAGTNVGVFYDINGNPRDSSPDIGAYEYASEDSVKATAVPTFESIGLYWSPSGGSSSNECTVQYRIKESSTWKQGFPLWFDASNNEYRGSLVLLEPDTEYEIRLTNSGSSSTITASTWSEDFPIAKTIEIPELSGSTYTISESGTADGYVLYTHEPGKTATIDVNNNHNYNINVGDSHHVIIRGVTCLDAQTNAIYINDNAHDIIIEDNDISNWGVDGPGSSSAAIYLSGTNYVSNIERVIIQRNKIHHPRHSTNSWIDPTPGSHPHGASAVLANSPKGNHVWRYNSIYGDANHNFEDGFSGWDNFARFGSPGSPARDTDIYGNYISDCWDDAIESEGNNRNVRIWGNFIKNKHHAIGSVTTAEGPLYIFRNIAVTTDTPSWADYPKGGFLKQHDDSTGKTYVFHNTILQKDSQEIVLGGDMGLGSGYNGLINTISRNNILHVVGAKYSINEYTPYDPLADYDYDLYNGKINAIPGQEAHGIINIPSYSSGLTYELTSGITGQGTFNLERTSAGHDSGEIIPNFNDGFFGNAPDIGAHEAGAQPMEFGVDAYRTQSCPNHDADDDCDGCINISELIDYISEWKIGSVTISELMDAIGLWKSGC